MVLRACRNAGFAPSVVYWGGETLPMLLMAQRGQGIAFAPQSFAQLGLQGLPDLVPVDNAEFRTHLNMIWPQQHALTPIANRVRELIMTRFAPGQCSPPLL